MKTIHREIVGAFIFSNDGYMILGNSIPGGVYPGYYIVPGGGVKEGETKLQALSRELYEELGLDISSAKKAQIDKQAGQSEKVLPESGEKVNVTMTFNDFHVVFNRPASEIIIKTGDDFTNARWVSVNDFGKYKLVQPTINVLQKLGYL